MDVLTQLGETPIPCVGPRRRLVEALRGRTGLSRGPLARRGRGGIAPEQDGSFRFFDLEPDVYTLVITYAGGLGENPEGSGYTRHEQEVTARRSSVSSLGLIRLELGTGSVSGSITLAEGVDGSRVTVKLSRRRYPRAGPRPTPSSRTPAAWSRSRTTGSC